jgi:hypothetical protein
MHETIFTRVVTKLGGVRLKLSDAPPSLGGRRQSFIRAPISIDPCTQSLRLQGERLHPFGVKLDPRRCEPRRRVPRARRSTSECSWPWGRGSWTHETRGGSRQATAGARRPKGEGKPPRRQAW